MEISSGGATMRKKSVRPACVDGLEVDAGVMVAVRETQAARHQRPAVGDGDPAAHAGRAQTLAPLQHAEQGVAVALAHAEQADELGQHGILVGAAEIECDRVGLEEFPEMHGRRGSRCAARESCGKVIPAEKGVKAEAAARRSD